MTKQNMGNVLGVNPFLSKQHGYKVIKENVQIQLQSELLNAWSVWKNNPIDHYLTSSIV